MTVYAVPIQDLNFSDIEDITNWTEYGLGTRKKQGFYYYLTPPIDNFYMNANEPGFMHLNPEIITKEKFLLLKIIGLIPRNIDLPF